jgi:hypothetical protein
MAPKAKLTEVALVPSSPGIATTVPPLAYEPDEL